LSNSPTQLAAATGLPRLRPARLDDFKNTYGQVSGAAILSIHSISILDNALRQAERAQLVLLGDSMVRIFEAGTIDGGLQFLVETAAWLVAEQQVPIEVLPYLLTRIERQIATFVLTREPAVFSDKLVPVEQAGVPSASTVMTALRLDPIEKAFVPVTEINLLGMQRNGWDIIAQWTRRSEEETTDRIAWMTALLQCDTFKVREMYFENPRMPGDLIGIVAFPSREKIAEIIGQL
jgi:hypothetical protein